LKPPYMSMASLLICDDMAAFKRLWRNKITRILLVVVFTNIGATPLMVKVLA